MTTTEANLDLPVEPVEYPHSNYLPLTAADVAPARETERPRHGWPASLFIFLANFTAIGCGIGAVGAALGFVIAVLVGEPGNAGLAALVAMGLGLGALLQSQLAKHVDHFSKWGWWGAMAELALATLSKVNVLVTAPEAFPISLAGIVIDVLWMGYFWNRRADFGIDLDI